MLARMVGERGAERGEGMTAQSHIERIVCPSCGKVQDATVEHTWPWWSYVHECDCGYIIGESEWPKEGGAK